MQIYLLRSTCLHVQRLAVYPAPTPNGRLVATNKMCLAFVVWWHWEYCNIYDQQGNGVAVDKERAALFEHAVR